MEEIPQEGERDELAQSADEPMESESKKSFLSLVLEKDDYESLPDGLRERVETAVEDKIDAFLVQETRHMALKEEYGKEAERVGPDA